MSVILLVFVLAATGEAATFGVQFASMEVCEAAKPKAMQIVQARGAVYVGMACVEPVEVKGI